MTRIMNNHLPSAMKLRPQSEKLAQVERTCSKQNIGLTHHHILAHLMRQLQSTSSRPSPH